MRDFFLTAFLACVAPVAILRPWIGVLAFFWLGFLNPHKLSWGFARGMPFAQIMAICTLLGLVITRERKSVPWTFELVLMLVMAAHFCFTTLLSWAPEHAWPQLEKVLKIYFMIYIMTMLIHGRYKVHIMMLMTALSIGFYGFKGGIFTLTSGGANSVLGPEGTFIEGNTFVGLAMVMVLPLLVFLAREEQKKWMKRLLYTTAFLTGISIIFTYSRGAMLGLGAVLPLLFLKSRAKIWFLLIFVPTAYAGYMWAPSTIFQRAELIAEYGEDRSAMQRLQAWSVSWHLALEKPVQGAGFEFEYAPDTPRWLSYADRKYDPFGDQSRAAHSIYFQVLGHHGFVGLAMFLAVLIAVMVRLIRLRKLAQVNPEFEWFANYSDALLIGMVGYLVSGAFLNAAYFDLMYVYVGIAAVLQREARSAQAALNAPPAKPRYGLAGVRSNNSAA